MFVLPLNASDATLNLVGGKGANLARLVRAGLPVPAGFLLTTYAYQLYIAATDLADEIMDRVAAADTRNPAALQQVSQQIRGLFSAETIPPTLIDAILEAYPDPSQPVAVRSSATAEDLPDMSFAGQQDTFLNVIGEQALLAAVVNCWSSLWTARAIGYRARNGIDHSVVALAVVVQNMVPSAASGVLFTANPLNGRRDQMVIDATLGLGEALVSGQVEPDHYVVDSATGAIVQRSLGAKATVIHGKDGGGIITTNRPIAENPAVSDEVVDDLVVLGRQVAALFDFPQDIEWGWTPESGLALLQSRPITSLFPCPENASVRDDKLRIFFSFGAVQGMLDPVTPLGREAIRGIFAGMAAIFDYRVPPEKQRLVWHAGERLWIDLTPPLLTQIGRKIITNALALIEPASAEALRTLYDGNRFPVQRNLPRLRTIRHLLFGLLPMIVRLQHALRHPDATREQLQLRFDDLVAHYTLWFRHADTLADRVRLAESVFQNAFPALLPRFVPAVGAGMAMLNLLTRLVHDLPDGRETVLLLTRGLPHNVTTEMDLVLWRTAQAIREDDAARMLFAELDATQISAEYRAGSLPPTAQTALTAFMARYGMRGLAEIDLGRRRWREEPTQVIRTVQSYLNIADPAQAPDAVFARGEQAAEDAAGKLEKMVRRSPGGFIKARAIRFAVRRIRALTGLRESPKFTIVNLLGLVRHSLLVSGAQLTADGVLDSAEDIFFLTMAELKTLAGGKSTTDWQAIVAARRQLLAREAQRKQIPRILLSDGQAFYEGVRISAETGPNDPEQIIGTPVSPGVVEGTVRVVFDPTDAHLQPGDILVCPGTDPAWTPLFLTAAGLITEVGGLMTHGSVVAREYGIPAVVGVDQATQRLQTGQRVRVDGMSGRIVVVTEE